jgi:endonuclease/exonuclease/phosphatase family metal-dependent hydrolase
MRFRLLSWNIHKGIGGLDGRYDIQRVIRAIEQSHPDIVQLQEVDDDAPRSRHHRQVDVLADALAMPHRAYQPNVTLRRGAYGNAIISRFPLNLLKSLDLSIRFKKKRGAQIVSVAIPVPHQLHQPVMLVNLHLGLIEFEQKIQLRRLLACEEVKGLDHQVPMIVAGDMNDMLGRLGRHVMEPRDFRSASDGKSTFPAFFPMRALDQIFYRGGLALHRCFIPRSEVTRQASDHLPLVADFEVAVKQGHEHAGQPHAHAGAKHKAEG